MKSNIILISFFLFSFFCTIIGQDFQIKTNIDSIVNKANAVILEEEYDLKIFDIDDAEYRVKKKILIKNKNGLEYCRLVLVENKFQKIEEMDAVITDVDGSEIKELDSDDINEAEISPGFVFYSGNLYKWFEFTHHSFPFIVEIEYELFYKTTFIWPDYYPQYDIPNLKSTYRLQIDKSILFHYKTIGDVSEPKITSEDDEFIYTWRVDNMPPRIVEDYMPPDYKTQNGVRFSPDKFLIEGFNGSFTSWNDFANWYRLLSENKYDLTPEAKEEIIQLVENIDEPKKKVEKLYKYMQQKTRYVAIEMGIGGWQPHSATEVFKNAYGDCKDLSTFMISMLKEIGIKAYPALARTRDRGKLFPDFPFNGFNHCIACVPLENDTLWLECTASYTDMEDTPYSIEDISVLLIDDQSGKLITTPKGKSESNLSRSIVDGKLTLTGNFKFSASITANGNQKNYLKNKFEFNDMNEDILFIKNRFGKFVSNLHVDEYSVNSTSNNEYNLAFTGNYQKFVSVRGKRIFLTPALLNRETIDDLPDEKVNERKFPVFYNYPYVDIDTVIIEIPESYKLEAVPKNTILETPFSKYSSEYLFDENILTYIRRMEISETLIPLESYGDYYDFMKSAIKSDASSIVFKK